MFAGGILRFTKITRMRGIVQCMRSTGNDNVFTK